MTELTICVASQVNAFDADDDVVEHRSTGQLVPVIAAEVGELASAIDARRFATLKSAQELSR